MKYSFIIATIISSISIGSAYCHAASSFKILHQGFTDSPKSNLLLSENDQTIYGYTDYDLYSLSLQQGKPFYQTLIKAGKNKKYQELYSFSGRLTWSLDKAYIYGVKNSFRGGELYRFNVKNQTVETLHRFDYKDNLDGYDAQGGVVLSHDGRYLYGVTESGGKGGISRSTTGVIYRLALDGSDKIPYKVLHDFKGDQNEGGAPLGSLALSQDGAYLYGITSYKGPKNCGTAFQLSLIEETQSNFKTIHAFDCVNEDNRNNGGKPNDIILSKNGNYLYGTAYKTNWYYQNGVIYQIVINQNNFPSKVLHVFTKQDGVFPGELTLSEDGKTLYGTTVQGGPFSRGGIYKLVLSNNQSVYTMLYAFGSGEYNDLSNSEEALALNVDESRLYGTTKFGAANGQGSIFELNLRDSQ
jgi:uncharacterized repeat protein (TIGR03803 family)